MNLLRWRGLWAAILGGLSLAMPVAAQTGVALPGLSAGTGVPPVDQRVPAAKMGDAPPAGPIPTVAPKESAEGADTKLNVLPAPDATGPVPVLHETSSLLDHSPDEGHKEPKPGAWLFDADYFLMTSRSSGREYAIAGTNPILGPIGTIKTVGTGNYNSGFRLGAGYRFPGEDVEVMFRYTFLHTTAGDGTTRPGGQLLFATETHPGLIVQVDSASARSTVNLNLFDVELGKRIDFSESTTARLFAGPRFANIDQKFNAVYQGGDVTGNANRDDVRRRVYFDGGGVRAGGEVQWKFFDQIGTYFRGAGSLMAGQFRSDLTETGSGTPVVNVSEKFTRVVPNLEMGLGLIYQSGNWRMSVGYEFSTWFDMVDGIDFVSDAHPAKMGRKTGNLSLDGVVFRSELAF